MEPEEERSLRRPGHRFEDKVEMDLREIVWNGVEWIYLAHDRDQWRAVVNMAMKLRFP
jgi:hypothetical protein